MREEYVRVKILCAIPAVVSAFILGAHFLRGGYLPLAVVCASAPLLLLLRSSLGARIVQALLVIGFFVWIDTGLSLFHERIALGMPWKRMASIMLGVALFSLGSAALLEKHVKREDA